MKTIGEFIEAHPRAMTIFFYEVITSDTNPREFNPFLANLGKYANNDRTIDDLVIAVMNEPYDDEVPEGWYYVEFPRTRGEAPAAYWKFAREHATGPIIVMFPNIERVYFQTEAEAVHVALMLPEFRYENYDDR